MATISGEPRILSHAHRSSALYSRGMSQTRSVHQSQDLAVVQAEQFRAEEEFSGSRRTASQARFGAVRLWKLLPLFNRLQAGIPMHQLLKKPVQEVSMSKPPHRVEVFFDGACPLCRKEIAMLRWWDRHHRICFTDITEESFDATAMGVSMEDLIAEIHGRAADGTLIRGVEVFRQLYSSVGFRWLVAVTRVPGIAYAFDCAYSIFAKHRLKLTGRCTDTCRIPSR